MTKQSKVAAEAAANPTVISVAYDQLVVDDANVRAGAEFNQAEMDKLVASIESVGLLQPLVCVLKAEGYSIVAGRRRHHALGIVAEKAKAKNLMVPVLLIDETNAMEASLAENYAREAMDTRQLYTAFKKLSDEGKSEADIAAQFGWDDKRVKRVLRLSNLAEPVREAWFNGQLKDGQAQAYAATDNHEIQLAVFERIGGAGHWSADGIRREIMELVQGGNVNDRELRFVGLEAYKEAGGKYEQDLFSDSIAVLDGTLLHKLATKKLKAEAKAIEKALGVKIEWGGETPKQSRYGYEATDYDCRLKLKGETAFASAEDEARFNEINALFENDEGEIDEEMATELQLEMEDIEDRKVEVLPKLDGVEKLVGVGPKIDWGGTLDYELFYPSREAAGLPPLEERKEESFSTASTSLHRSIPYESTGNDVALANKKAMGATKDGLAALQVIYADTVATETVIAAEAGNTTGLDALLFIIARRVTWPHSGPAGLPDIRLGANGEGRGSHKVRQLVGGKPNLGELLNNPAWLEEKSDALAFDAFMDWVGDGNNRVFLGAALLGQIWHPLSKSYSEGNKPTIVNLVAEALDPGPTDWAGRFDREKVAGMVSHKYRVEALQSFGLGDHAKGLKKDTSLPFLMKVFDADSDQRKLWGIDEETGNAIESWLPVELEIHPVKRPDPNAAVEADEDPQGADWSELQEDDGDE